MAAHSRVRQSLQNCVLQSLQNRYFDAEPGSGNVLTRHGVKMPFVDVQQTELWQSWLLTCY